MVTSVTVPDAHTQHHELSVQDLHVHYGPVCALHHVDFQTCCGRLTAILGANGAGKSTLIQCIAGLVTPSTGSILWRGEPLKGWTRDIAYLPQRSEVDWAFPLTVRGFVETGRYPHCGLFRRFGAADRDAVDQAMEQMKIHDLRHRQIGALSGGQQQRIFIARALAQEAHVLLFDEPFNGLDSPTAKTLFDVLHALRDQGRLILAAHHQLETVEDQFDEVLLLNRTLLRQGSASDIMNSSELKEQLQGNRS